MTGVDDTRRGLLLRHMAAFIILGVLLGTAGCAPWQLGAEKDVMKNGIMFKTFRENENGTKLGILVEDTVIDGWPCKKDFVVFHADWRLDELELSRDYQRNGVFMPKGTRVFPDAAGGPGTCMFPRDMEIQGYLVRGTGRNGFMTRFYRTGNLMLFWSKDPVEVDGVICRDSLFDGIYLHDNGRLRECVLDKQGMIGKVAYPKGTRLKMDESGKVINRDP